MKRLLALLLSALVSCGGVPAFADVVCSSSNLYTCGPTLLAASFPGSVLAADYTNATAAMTNTALSTPVVGGRKYTFIAALFVVDSIAADGAQIDFNGGTATATNFRVHCLVFDTALLKSQQATALATAISQATVTGAGLIECYGAFEPATTGTLVVRAAQVAHTTGTLTVTRGSTLQLTDVP